MDNHLNVAPSLKTKPLKKGQHSFKTNMLMVRCKDKKKIYFLSTIHETNTITAVVRQS